MKTIDSITQFKAYSGFAELDQASVDLIKLSRESAKNAHSPYSRFKVGAAILLNNGTCITGNNQENAAYPSGLCAERTAAFYASSQFPEIPFSKLAITSINPDGPSSIPISPCGGCRQVLLEYEQKFGQNIEVILASETDEIYVFKCIKDLLPFSFSSAFLPKN